MEILGLDHLYLTVSDLARAEAFYDPVMEGLGFFKGDRPIAGEPHVHYFNRAMQISLRPARDPGARHDPYRPGLHHVCLQAESRAAVDEAEALCQRLGIEVTAAAEYPEYNDDYYAIFFADPDGIRLEILARSKYRRRIVERFGELEGFLNPMSRLPD